MKNTNRRDVLKKMAAGTVAAAAAPWMNSFAAEETNSKNLKLKGNINHSVCQWTYNFLSLDDLCAQVKKNWIWGD